MHTYEQIIDNLNVYFTIQKLLARGSLKKKELTFPWDKGTSAASQAVNSCFGDKCQMETQEKRF